MKGRKTHAGYKKMYYLCIAFFQGQFPMQNRSTEGKMLEWLKRHAWKACIPLKGIGGSNPPLSAKK